MTETLVTKTLAWNTGRTYTECGQRIAAALLDNGCIIMLDIDRHIDVLFSDATNFNQHDIMWDYDRNLCSNPNWVDLPYDTYYAVLDELRSVANQVPCI